MAAKKLKAGCCYNAIEVLSIQTGEQSVMPWEKKKEKKLLGPFTWYRNNFVQERVHIGCHMIPE